MGVDLNYLFYRQQVERSMADNANSKRVCDAHKELASRYEARIEEARHASEAKKPVFQREGSEKGGAGADVNATLAVGLTARAVSKE